MLNLLTNDTKASASKDCQKNLDGTCHKWSGNLAERGLKPHMKISGQFEPEAVADNHALIRTRIETCHKSRNNEIDALERLCAGCPYSVAEIFSLSHP